ncbi:hypothetical protein BTO23_03460 [Aliivibrio sifiae]|uniref:Uncharacterized protein n=1 Tax=Aliivibrio sifiae TaxID=566293 RepID=A0A2S7XHM3_9GAMM|nr:hypothetical protein BTO23_03460 [Aliivibrio sifiae]GLR76002.1 hypothetical protein GCM10007855_28760 [Aliivibrio sifiae]
MNELIIYIIVSIFALLLTKYIARLVSSKIDSTLWILAYIVFNIFIGAQHYSICFNKELIHDYGFIHIQVTDSMSIAALIFMILQSCIWPKRINKLA